MADDDDDDDREDEEDEDPPMPDVEDPDLSAAEVRLLEALWDRRHRAGSA